jgi:glucose-6-phosphate isomerase
MEQNENKLQMYLGNYKNNYENAFAELKGKRIVERLWEKDFTVWSNKPDEITNRLGWLDSPKTSLQMLDKIEKFVEQVIKDGLTHALLLGMGGSSLAPEVFRLTFGKRNGFLDLTVLDSTDPGAVLECTRKLDPAKTLYIVSTKSGGTVETFSFMKYFYNQALTKLDKEKTGNHFIAITDPGSGLETIAKQLNFRKIFLNDPNIGGRYSALSLFGIVPAALIGLDIEKFLNRALVCTQDNSSSEKNISAILGVAIGEFANLKKDKVTFITSNQLSNFGIWVEQLIAESTGKNGKGILPVVGEEILSPEFYLNDRLFIYLRLEDDKLHDQKIEALKKAGHPVIEIILKNIYDLGAEMFRWEIATAIASWRIGVQPFDQPNVESAKIVARKMVQEYKDAGKLPELKIAFNEEGIAALGEINETNLNNTFKIFFENINRKSIQLGLKSYISIQAYLKPDEKTLSALQTFTSKIQKKYKIASTIGFGPRFLHSTGQLHKGDAGNGLFIQLISEIPEDTPIPDEAGGIKSLISFGVLKNAQALGDRQALLDNQRNVLTFKIGIDCVEDINKLSATI